MDWYHIFFSELQVILFSFSFFWRYFDFVVAWFCCSSWLAFLLLAYLMNLMHYLLLHWVICFGGCLFVHTPIVFLKNTWVFGIFYLFLIWQKIMPKLWMSGVGTLCAIAHYRVSLFSYPLNWGGIALLIGFFIAENRWTGLL